MQLKIVNLATVGFVLCTTFFFWSSLQYLGDHDWSFSRWRPTPEVPKPEEALLMKNQQLEQALEAARASLANVPAAIVTTTILEPTVTATAVPEAAASAGNGSDGFAYVFYATSDAYACSALVNIHRLHHVFNVTIPVHVLASSGVSVPYMVALQASNASDHIEQTPPLMGGVGGYYQDCLLKLLAFKIHTIDPSLRRVLAFDSDQLIMKNLDHLFAGLPDVDLAAPRAYWLAKDFLASTFLMINLSDRLWQTVKVALETVNMNKFDMDIINDLLGDTVMMLSGEFVTLNSHWEDWGLPKWYHSLRNLNMTTVQMVNKLAKAQGMGSRRQAEPDAYNFTKAPAIPLSARPPFRPKLWDVEPDPNQVAPPLPVPGTAFVGPRPAPRFPANHPISQELYRLQDAAAVIHFTARGKPWMKTPDAARAERLDAHPLLAGQFEVWRETATQVCPGGIPFA